MHLDLPPTPLTDIRFMARAVALAAQSMRCGEPPFGALVVNPRGDVVAEGTDEVMATADPTRHAEVNVVRLACHAVGPDLSGHTLYTTVEPCPMCFTSAWLAKVSRVVFGCTMDSVHAATNGQQRELRLSASAVNASSGAPLDLVGGVLSKECLRPFTTN